MTNTKPTPKPSPTDAVHAPHVPLTDYYQTEQDRQAYLRQIFDNTAVDYDKIEAMLALGTGSSYRRHALIRGGLKAGMKVLDVGVGTGLVAAQACILTGMTQGRTFRNALATTVATASARSRRTSQWNMFSQSHM